MPDDYPPFHTTRMGARFYERMLPELVEQIRRLAEAVERLVEVRQPEGPADGE